MHNCLPFAHLCNTGWGHHQDGFSLLAISTSLNDFLSVWTVAGNPVDYPPDVLNVNHNTEPGSSDQNPGGTVWVAEPLHHGTLHFGNFTTDGRLVALHQGFGGCSVSSQKGAWKICMPTEYIRPDGAEVIYVTLKQKTRESLHATFETATSQVIIWGRSRIWSSCYLVLHNFTWPIQQRSFNSMFSSYHRKENRYYPNLVFWHGQGLCKAWPSHGIITVDSLSIELHWEVIVLVTRYSHWQQFVHCLICYIVLLSLPELANT